MAFRGIWAIYIHSNVRLNIGPLKYLIGSPEMHHWHHSLDRDAGNYANISPLIDIIFGTHYAPGHEPEAFGIKEDFPEHYAGQLLHPLCSKRILSKLRFGFLKKKLALLFLLIPFLSFSQTKEQLINSIVKSNRFESEHIGIAGVVSPNYKCFSKLTALIPEDELQQLTYHKNGVLRMYACTYFIEEKNADPIPFLLHELKKNTIVETMSGCLMDDETTAEIIYLRYRGKICLEAAKDIPYNENAKREKAMADILKTDKKMKEIDSLVISTDMPVSWILYSRAFEDNNFSKSLLPTIEKLGFQKNNPYAIGYLTTAYPQHYKEEALKYYTDQFPKLKFSEENWNGMMYFHEFLELLLKTGNKKIQQIAVESLKKSNYNQKTWFINLFKEYEITL